MMGGIVLSIFVVADLGLDPWDVLHQGIAKSTGASLGTIVILSSLTVLMLWIPSRQRPGPGTLSDVVVIGLVIDASLAILPRPNGLALQMGFLAAALVLNGVSTSMYIGARMGAGPRDGLMTGLAARGWSIRRSRIAIDLSVLTAGWFLGGTVGMKARSLRLCQSVRLSTTCYPGSVSRSQWTQRTLADQLHSQTSGPSVIVLERPGLRRPRELANAAETADGAVDEWKTISRIVALLLTCKVRKEDSLRSPLVSFCGSSGSTSPGYHSRPCRTSGGRRCGFDPRRANGMTGNVSNGGVLRSAKVNSPRRLRLTLNLFHGSNSRPGVS